MRAIARVSRRAAAAEASAAPRGVLKRNDAGDFVPLDGSATGGGADTNSATPAEARQVREIDGQGWAR